MTHCCSQCSFTAQFESALIMHRQLHHETADEFPDLPSKMVTEKSGTIPRAATLEQSFSRKTNNRGLKWPGRLRSEVDDEIIEVLQPPVGGRSSSATRLFDKLRARICRSKTLFAHPEEIEPNINNLDLTANSECTSKAMKIDCLSRTSGITTSLRDQKEIYSCHLCEFDADRITVLDRHLLNDHKIGLENLLKLVMAKTKDGLTEDHHNNIFLDIRQPYYKPIDEIIEEGEFIIETVSPKIKILKHATTNTDVVEPEYPNMQLNCRMISQELDKLMKCPMEKCGKDELMVKMQTLNECMCKFVDSSNTLKKVLSKEFDKHSMRTKENFSCDEPIFDLRLGDMETPREWERAHSEKLERNRNKYDKSRNKPKLAAESFFF